MNGGTSFLRKNKMPHLIDKVWTDDERVYARTKDGLVASYAFSRWPRLRDATKEQRDDFHLSYGGIHWPQLDEDLCFDGMFHDAGLCALSPSEYSVCYIPDNHFHEIHIHDLQDLDRAAGAFLEEIGDRKLIALYGSMGAGKTTFTTAVCKRLGVQEDAVSSPTFAIVNEYRTGSGKPMYHFDFYRIERLEEAYDIGLYDYLDSGFLCLMEWPENIGDLLPEETLKVHISVNPDGSRILTWED